MSVKKHPRAEDIVEADNLPCICLVDSGGVHLPNQHEEFPDRDLFGRRFFNQARTSARDITQIAVVMDSCTAEGTYVPAMWDVTIIVEDQGKMLLADPPLVNAATSEVVSAGDLGSGDVHTRLSELTCDDAQALTLAGEAVFSLWVDGINPAPKSVEPPVYDSTELLGVVPTDLRTTYDIREVIARLVEGSRFDELKVRISCNCFWSLGSPWCSC